MIWLVPAFALVWIFGGLALLDFMERRHFRQDDAHYLRTGEHLPQPWWWVE